MIDTISVFINTIFSLEMISCYKKLFLWYNKQGLLKKYAWVRVEVRTQNSGVRINGNYTGGSRIYL